MQLNEHLQQYLDAGYPILYIHSFEEIKTDSIIRSAVNQRKAIEWNGADGLVDFDTKLANSLENEFTDPETALCELREDIYSNLDRHLLILKDILPYLENPRIIAQIKQICHEIEKGLETTIIIVAPLIVIPKELEKFITILEMPYLSEDEISAQIQRFADDYKEFMNEQLRERMSIAFKGLSEFEIENLLASSLATHGEFCEQNLSLILEQKRQMMLKSNILEMIPVKENPEDIGGLNQMKTWLQQKAMVFQQIKKAKEYGVKMPKGVLIVGVPGCGKSLTAKVTAKMFDVPLLRLDIGKIMGKYLGESESNLREAIKLAEAISPCVLWVDELEKGFAGANGDGHEVTVRLFGSLLTWLQEKESPVFVIATANDVSKLPQELLRKGRFDEIFYVDLPNQMEREEILRIHMKKHRPQDCENDQIDFGQLAAKMDKGYSGADLESVIVETIERCFVAQKDSVTTSDIQATIVNICPIKKMIGQEKIDELLDYYRQHSFKAAT